MLVPFNAHASARFVGIGWISCSVGDSTIRLLLHQGGVMRSVLFVCLFVFSFCLSAIDVSKTTHERVYDVDQTRQGHRQGMTLLKWLNLAWIWIFYDHFSTSILPLTLEIRRDMIYSHSPGTATALLRDSAAVLAEFVLSEHVQF